MEQREEECVSFSRLTRDEYEVAKNPDQGLIPTSAFKRSFRAFKKLTSTPCTARSLEDLNDEKRRISLEVLTTACQTSPTLPREHSFSGWCVVSLDLIVYAADAKFNPQGLK